MARTRGRPASGTASLNQFSRQPSRAVPLPCLDPWKRRKVLEQSPVYRSLAGRGWIKYYLVSNMTNCTPSRRQLCPWHCFHPVARLVLISPTLLTDRQKSPDLSFWQGSWCSCPGWRSWPSTIEAGRNRGGAAKSKPAAPRLKQKRFTAFSSPGLGFAFNGTDRLGEIGSVLSDWQPLSTITEENTGVEAVYKLSAIFLWS